MKFPYICSRLIIQKMTYDETLHYLYTSIPVFQHSGASAYKPGLGTSLALDDLLAHPHQAYRTIHVAGTNGKGSVSHLLADYGIHISPAMRRQMRMPPVNRSVPHNTRCGMCWHYHGSCHIRIRIYSDRRRYDRTRHYGYRIRHNWRRRHDRHTDIQ